MRIRAGSVSVAFILICGTVGAVDAPKANKSTKIQNPDINLMDLNELREARKEASLRVSRLVKESVAELQVATEIDKVRFAILSGEIPDPTGNLESMLLQHRNDIMAANERFSEEIVRLSRLNIEMSHKEVEIRNKEGATLKAEMNRRLEALQEARKRRFGVQ